MANLKRLSTKDDVYVEVSSPVSKEELLSRTNTYEDLDPRQFARKHREALYHPVFFSLDGKQHSVQYNHCSNPFCKWYGLPQEKFNDAKGKPSRYRLDALNVTCNPDPIRPNVGVTLGCSTGSLSNWSIIDEIHRLIRINSVQDQEPNYNFHKVDCRCPDITPFEHPEQFYKQGRSSSTRAQQWQCKNCKKKTTLQPTRKQSITYKQKRSEINLWFAKLLIGRMPVTRESEALGIGKGTYYDKLKFVYRRCLEFLERHETKPLKNKSFKEMWINTDKMIYFLNNPRKKGKAKGEFKENERVFSTNVVISADVHSRYVFRSDVAYDWEVSLDDIANDTQKYKEDHLYEFAKKNARFDEFSHYPQPPSLNDTQSDKGYHDDLRSIQQRKEYVDGLRVHQTYTTIAHYWLIKQLVNASEWRFVSDDDASIARSINRVFSKDIQLSNAHHFLCLTNKSNSKRESEKEHYESVRDLQEWGERNEYNTKSAYKLASLQLERILQTHQFHKVVNTSSGSHLEYANNPLEHPLATKDTGHRIVDCKTNLSSFEPKDIAELLMEVNDHATNRFIQLIRRRLSILERPLSTARADLKSYIYANINPEYAQMVITILRVYHNFCMPIKSGKVKKTPAQRLGITDKVFDLKDIIYFR